MVPRFNRKMPANRLTSWNGDLGHLEGDRRGYGDTLLNPVPLKRISPGGDRGVHVVLAVLHDPVT